MGFAETRTKAASAALLSLTAAAVVFTITARSTAAGSDPAPAAGSAVSFSLDEALLFALTHNSDLESLMERRREERAKLYEARASAFPIISFNSAGTRYQDPGLLNSEGFEEFAATTGYQPSPQSSYTMSFNLEQSLFTWGRIPSAIKYARLQFGATDIEQAQLEVTVSANVAAAYFRCLLQEEELRLLDAALERQRTALQITEDRLSLGDATRLDQLLSQVALQNLLPRRLEVRNQIKLAYEQLNFLLNRPPDAPLRLTSSLEVGDPSLALSRPALVRFALDHRQELRTMAILLEMMDHEAAIYTSFLRPTVDARGAWGYSVADAANAGKPDYQAWSATLSVRVPLFDGFKTQARVSQVDARQAQLRIRQEQTRQALALEVHAAADAVDMAVETLSVTALALDLSREALRVAEESYRLGAATLLELLDAERGQREAEVNGARARAFYLTALAQLKKALGLRFDQALPEAGGPAVPPADGD